MGVFGNTFGNSLGSQGSNTNHTMSVLKNTDYVYLRTSYSETQDLIQKLFIGSSDVAFSPAYVTYLITKETIDTISAYENGTYIHIASDDCAPVYMPTSYIGGSHGLSQNRTIICNNHGKTVEDVGSVWINGSSVKFIITKIVDANTFWMIQDNLHRDWYPKWYFSNNAPTGTLTHYSGATHTDNIIIGSSVAGMLIPAIKNKTLAIKLNGNTNLGVNGLYRCSSFVIEESYDIVNPADAIDYILSQVGSNTQPAINTGNAMYSLSNRYTYNDNSSCIVYNQFIPRQTVDFGYFGGTQSTSLYVNGSLSKIQEYIPKSLPINLSGTDYDFRTVKDITSLPTTVNLTSAYFEDANNPPERFVQYLANSASQRQVGFAIGFIKGKGLEVNRKNYVEKAFSMSTIKKQYPYEIDTKFTLVNNTVYSGYMFRAYFSAVSLPSGRIAQYSFKDGSDTYIYLDWNTAFTDTIVMPIKFIGKSISILEKSANVTITDSVVSANLSIVIAASTPQNGYAILKIS